MNPKIDAAIAALQEDILLTLQKWIQIPSEKKPPEANAPFGLPLRQMLTAALEDAENLGMRVRDFDGYIGDIEMGQGAETMGILAHLDVVPAGDGWLQDPYGGEIINGMIYGRGASDDKGPAVAALYAMKAVLDAGLTPAKKVRLLLGCDEESGWDDIRYYQSRTAMPDFGFSPDAMYPVINTEKGLLQLSLLAKLPKPSPSAEGVCVHSIHSGERPNVIPGLATAEISGLADCQAAQTLLQKEGLQVEAHPLANGHIQLVSIGSAGHASMPKGCKNAAGQLLLALKALHAGDAQVNKLICCLADGIGLDYTGKGLGIDGADSISGPLTLNLGTLHLEDGVFSAMLDIRYPVLMHADRIVRIIGLHVQDAGISIEIASQKDPLHVPASSPIVQALLKVYHEVTGLPKETVAIGGGTYARSMENCVAFGSSFPGEKELAHQAGECISIESLMTNVRIMAYAIAELAC